MIRTFALALVFMAAVPAFAGEPAASPSPAPAPEPESHPGISLEPMYSEAVIAYNSKKPNEALKVLDQLLKIKADYVQALELKALLLKSMGKPEESRANYEALIKATTDKAKAAPYHFELGVIEYNAKHSDVAAAHFHEAAAQGFNADASHLFLGLIAFGEGDKAGKLTESEDEFKQVEAGKSAELRVAALYYLGLIEFKKGNSSEGTHQLIDARSEARSQSESKIAQDIDKAVDKALAPYGKGQLYGSVSASGGWNTNPAFQPGLSGSGVPNSSPPAGELLGSGTIGWVSSPLSTWQYVASYRASGNVYLPDNSGDRPFDYIVQTADLYLTKDALARTQYGFKLEGTWTLNQADVQDVNGNVTGGLTSNFSRGLELGPYVRRDLGHSRLLTVEAYFRPQWYQAPEYVGVTGKDFALRSTLAIDRSATWWNPTFNLAFEYNPTIGPTFQNWALDLGLTDLMRISERDTVSAYAGLNFYDYYNYSVNGVAATRNDYLVSIHGEWTRQLASHLNLVVDAGFQDNLSTEADVEFSQLVATAGVSYSL